MMPRLRWPFGRLSELSGDRRTKALAAFTIMRLGLIPPVIATFMVRPTLTILFLSAFMVADLYDGVLARKLDADGPERRAADSVVDRVAIDSCLIGAWAAGSMPGLVLLGLLARDLYCSGLCVWMFTRRRAAIKVDLLYRGLSFLIAVWALTAPFVSQSVRSVSAIALLGLAIVVAADLTKAVRRVVRSTEDVAGQAIPVGELRSEHKGDLRPFRTINRLRVHAT